MLIWIERKAAQKNAPTAGNAAEANAAEAASLDGGRGNDRPVDLSSAPSFSDSLTPDWMLDFRALVGSYEKERWQGLNDGTESRNFVPQRMRLVKHFFDLYDSACLAKDEASTAIMEMRLERLAFDPSSRWGGLL